VSGAAIVPHLPLHSPRGVTEASMAGSGNAYDAPGGLTPTVLHKPARLRVGTGPLPKVTTESAHVDIDLDAYRVWLQPSQESPAGAFCHAADAAGVALACTPLQRREYGLAAGVVISGPRSGPVVLMVVDSPVTGATAVSWSRPVRPAIYQLGQGYSLVVAKMPKQPADSGSLDEHVWIWNGERLIAGYGHELGTATDSPLFPADSTSADSTSADSAPIATRPAAVRSEGPRVIVGNAGEAVWMAPPLTSDGLPRVCQTSTSAKKAASCTPVNTGRGSARYQLSLTDNAGRDTELIVTDAAVTRATALLDGRPTSATVTDLGSGYRLVRAVFPVGFEQEHRVELAGLDAKGRSLVSTESGVRLTR
jgi:hypothetical protein